MSNRVSVTFGKVTRGGGKVFVLVGAPGASRIGVSSKGEGGRSLPASCLRIDDESWVAFVSVVEGDQTLLVDAFDADGCVMGGGRKVLGRYRSKISSSINTLRKDPVAEAIRNADRKLGASGVRLSVDELLRDGGEELLRGTVELCVRDEAIALAPISVDVLAISGDSISVACAHLDDVLFSAEGVTGANPLPNGVPTGSLLRRLRFSTRLSRSCEGLIVWVRLEGFPEWGAFETLEPFEAERLREETAVRYRSAAETDEYERRTEHEDADRTRRLAQMRAALPLMPERPLFSVIVPLYNTPPDFFAEMLDSVLDQAYPDLELLLVNASPENAELSAAVDAACARDSRVRRIDLDANLGITENTNAGIRAATGDFLCFLDHDDTIEPDALWLYARAALETPDVDLIYCDEDHLLDGRRIGPFYKPDWDPDLLCSENYVTHFLCVRRETLLSATAETGLPGREFDGAQDHNMTLLIGDSARAVAHVPRVLYHWRMHAGSTAGSEGVGQKSYALEAERLAVQAHLDRLGVPATAVMERRRPMRCDLVYDFAEKSRVSACIAHATGNPNLVACVEALVSSTDWPDLEVVVSGTLSPDERARLDGAMGSGRTLVVVDGLASSAPSVANNVPALLNRAIERATGEYVLLLDENACAFEGGDWLDELVGPVALAGSGCAGAKVEHLDRSIACAGYLVGDGRPARCVFEGYPSRADGYYEYNVLPHRASAVSASCMLLRRGDAAEGLAEDLPRTFDVSLCLGLAAKGRPALQQNNVIVTLANRPARRSDVASRLADVREGGLLMSRHAEAFVGSDPYYTPNAGVRNRYFGYFSTPVE